MATTPYFINTIVDLSGISELERRLDSLGMRMRLSGRDWMRMGATISAFYSTVLGTITGILGKGILWSDLMEDIGFALEDIADALATWIVPVLEPIVSILEAIAEVLERNPFAAWIVAGMLVVAIVSRFVAVAFKAVGFINLLAGSLLVAQRASLSFTQAFRYLIILLYQGREAAEEYLVSLGKIGKLVTPAEALDTLGKKIQMLSKRRAVIQAQVAALKDMIQRLQAIPQPTTETQMRINELTIELAKQEEKLFAVDMALESTQAEFDEISKQMEQSNIQSKGFRTTLGRVAKSAKSAGSTLLKLAGGGAVLTGVAGFLLANWEPLAELFSEIGELIIDMFEPLSPFIEALTTWIEENPDLAKTLLGVILGVLALIYVLPKLKSLFGIISKVGEKVTEAFGNLTGSLQTQVKGSWQNVMAAAALVAAFAALIAAVTYFIVATKGAGVGIWEAVAAFGVMLGMLVAFTYGIGLALGPLASMSSQVWLGVGAVIALIGAFIALTLTLTAMLLVLSQIPGGVANLYMLVGALVLTFGALMLLAAIAGAVFPLLMLGAIVLQALAFAAMMLGAAMLFAGAGIMLAGMGLGMIANVLPVIAAQVGTLFVFSAALFTLASACFAASAAFIALAFGITALSVALIALSGAFATLKMLGLEAVAAATATRLVEALVPRLQEGGIIVRGGLAVLHPGEEVRPARAVRREAEVGRTLVLQFYGPITDERYVREKIVPIIQKELARR